MSLILIYYLIVFIILLVCFLRIYNSGNTQQIKSKSFVNENSLNTGDLLFVRYNNPLGYFMRFWSGSPWTHMAMLYRKGLDLYVMETANYRDKQGVLFLPFEKWKKLNHKCEISVMKLTSPKEFNGDVVLKEFEKLTGRKLDTFGISWLRLLQSKKYQKLRDKENITCYEMIVHLLQESGIAKKNLTASSYFPSNIIDGNLNLEPGFKYSELKNLL